MSAAPRSGGVGRGEDGVSAGLPFPLLGAENRAVLSDPCAMLGAVETRSVSPVFVGRADELGILHTALARAADGEPQALLLGGEAGVGKTRLVEEFAAAACERGAVVVTGGCVEIGADGLPFAPFSSALHALRRRLTDAFDAAAAGREDELARVLPELRDLSAPGIRPGERGDEGATARLFELTARLLEQVAAEHPVVVVLEDLHWADASTRHLLSYLFRTLRTGRLTVVATYRADDVHRRHPLRPLLAELDRLRTVTRIELGRLTRDEVARQIAGIIAAEPERSLVDDIYHRSDGNAFFVEELAVSAAEGCATGLTDSLRDILLVRVESLPEAAQRVARLCAEGGSTVEYPLLAAVAGLGEDALIEALRAAVGANLLLASPDGDGYRFRHSLVREAVSDDLLPGERSRINRRYAQALEADPALIPAEARVMRLATYWYHAHDPAKALPAVLDASVEARHRHAYSEQLRLLERAMELWDGAPEDVRADLRMGTYVQSYRACGCEPAETRLDYLDIMAEATVAGRLCGERERALKISKRALRILDEAAAKGEGDPLLAAWFWLQRSRSISHIGRGDGWEEIARAQELVRGLPPSAVHAEVLANAAAWGMLHTPGPDALADAERAVEYARMVGDEETELHARLILGGLLVDSGSVDEGFAEMYAVRERSVVLGLMSRISNVHVNLPSHLESSGRSAEAVRICDEGIKVCRRHGLTDTKAWIRGNKAESLVSLGRWDEAVKAAEWTRRSALSDKPRGTSCTQLAAVAIGRGAFQEAADRLADARTSFGTHDPQPQHDLPMAHLTVELAAAQGRPLDARAELDRLVTAGLPPAMQQRYTWPLLRAAAQAEADARGLPAADAERAEAVARIRDTAKLQATPVPVWHAYEQWVRTELLRAEGRDTPGDWETTVTLLEPLDRPYDLSRARHRLAESLLARAEADDRDRATELLRLAAAVADHLGARPLAESVALLAQRARIGLTRDVPRPGAPADPAEEFGLTSRERDVLRLVTAGRSNRQIAEELFISPKTASVHVSNILAKLGVAGRGEAAALAHRLRLVPSVSA
ncbi:AAA family ATPase [Streptomyces sp. SID8379]|uniref:helix-turn-helix transcriptional regulator n=1 Tax=unclassified Streptomyces TaxID=2593676 RepID=UPI000A30D7F3|nr:MULTISPECIES: helix-turn-helix transcriptional regulator [unclassified Streptomyces]MYW63696.1 AAA family ATPase [Streptomyces sp. SID8379]